MTDQKFPLVVDRQGFLSLWFESGADAYTICKLMGHSNILVSQRTSIQHRSVSRQHLPVWMPTTKNAQKRRKRKQKVTEKPSCYWIKVGTVRDFGGVAPILGGIPEPANSARIEFKRRLRLQRISAAMHLSMRKIFSNTCSVPMW